MSRITLSGNASGTGNFTLASPGTNTDRTLTLPDATGTVNVSGLANEVPAGSAGAPAIYPTGDTNTGIFFPAADTVGFSAGGAERVRIDANGIKFNGDTASANALDDYEEGTWSSAISGVTASTATATGRYTKIGNVVSVNGILTVSGYSSGSGNSNFTLPFLPIDANTVSHGLQTTFNNINAAYIFVAPFNGAATTFIYTNAQFALPGANWTNGQIVFNGTYLVL
jgi:hypothetical protein